MVCPKPYSSPHSPNIQFGLFQTPVYYLLVTLWHKHGKGLTSCTTMCSLTPTSPLLVSPATRLVLTNQRTRIMTVFGLPIVTGLPHFLVRYQFLKQDALVKQLVQDVYHVFISPNFSPAVCLSVCCIVSVFCILSGCFCI